MRIAVSTYSFSQLVGAGRMTELEVIAKARAMGFEGIEFTGFSPPAGRSAAELAAEVRAECDRIGIRPVCYTVGADFLGGSGGDWRAEVERLKGDIAVARTLGVSLMRHDAAWGFSKGHVGPRGFDDALPVLAGACRAVAEFAAARGIRTMVENHGFFCQESERVEKLVNAVGHANFGALLDVANFLCADEDPARAVGRLAPYAFHVHVKDFHVRSGDRPDPGRGWFQSRGGSYLRGAIIGHGDVPVLQCLRVLRRSGYDGALAIEFEGLEDPVRGIEIGLENLMRYADLVG